MNFDGSSDDLNSKFVSFFKKGVHTRLIQQEITEETKVIFLSTRKGRQKSLFALFASVQNLKNRHINLRSKK